MASRYYVGSKPGGKREVFRSATTPTETSHGHRYRYVTGPFRTLGGARVMVEAGENNPHIQTVHEAEKIAAGYVYDVALGKWVKRAAPTRHASARVARNTRGRFTRMR
jgi:hypothetical protein